MSIFLVGGLIFEKINSAEFAQCAYYHVLSPSAKRTSRNKNPSDLTAMIYYLCSLSQIGTTLYECMFELYVQHYIILTAYGIAHFLPKPICKYVMQGLL